MIARVILLETQNPLQAAVLPVRDTTSGPSGPSLRVASEPTVFDLVLPGPRAAQRSPDRREVPDGLRGAPGPAVGAYLLIAPIASTQNEFPMPPALAPAAAGDSPLLGTRIAGNAPRPSRLSGDGWVLWRGGSGASTVQRAGAYGRSQAGVVARYHLDPGSRLDPAAHLRLTHTLAGPRQAEAALGVSLRPVRRLPLDFAGEVRMTETVDMREVRPAVFAVTRLPPASLPLGLRGEAYLQGGYVGGRFATAFVDGQAQVDSRVIGLGTNRDLRVGMAGWGGAQKGAARLDVGPVATVDLALGPVRPRLALGYRVRIAGNAEPGSGPAVTISAGF